MWVHTGQLNLLKYQIHALNVSKSNWRLNMKNSEFYEDVINDCFGYTLGSIWDYFQYKEPILSYEERIDKFLYILRRAMTAGILKLAKEEVFLEETPQEISDRFKLSFPASEEKMSDVLFCLDSDDNFWIPGGAVWICSDGDKIWT